MRIGELAERAGTTVRTVRYYVAEGLLPPPVGGGPHATYGYEHLVRLGAIRALKASYLPLAEIRRRLRAMSLEEIEALVVAPDEPETALDAVGRPLGGTPDLDARLGAGRPRRTVGRSVERPPVPTARRSALPLPGRPNAAASPAAFALPSARPRLAHGSVTLISTDGNLWQRVVLAPGVELSFQPTDDPARARAIAELIEHATAYLSASSSRASAAR